MMAAFKAIFMRDLRLHWGAGGGALNPLLFFIMVVVLFPLGLDIRAQELSQIFPGVVWVAALLATMMGSQGLFREDYADGSLQQMLLSPTPLIVLLWAKLAALWVAAILPLILISPLVLLMYDVPADLTGVLIVSLLLGTPSLVCISALGAGLTVSLGGAGLLMAVICLPLYIPILIFGAGLLLSALQNMVVTGPLYLLGAFLLAAVFLLPVAISAALHIGLNE